MDVPQGGATGRSHSSRQIAQIPDIAEEGEGTTAIAMSIASAREDKSDGGGEEQLASLYPRAVLFHAATVRVRADPRGSGMIRHST